MTICDYDSINFIVSVMNWAIKIKSNETDYTIEQIIPMRQENSIEVAISLLWNASIHFIFLSRMEGEISLQYREVYLHI